MMTDNRITRIWQALSSEKNLGLYKRLIDEKYSSTMFCTYNYPDQLYGIAVAFDNNIQVEIASFNDLKEIRVDLIDDSTFPHSSLLIVQLLNKDERSLDVFATLCNDLFEALNSVEDEESSVKLIINKLIIWRDLFSKDRLSILSIEKQQGLYGELVVLRDLLKEKIDPGKVLDLWVGPEGSIQDFRGEKWALEVKTTSSTRAQSIKINGERQLDESFVDKLFLFHVIVDVNKKDGETLPSIISNIEDILSDNLYLKNIFDDKLNKAGYLSNDAYLYNNRYYIVKNKLCYNVRDDFPRIKESDLRNGVDKIEYHIEISGCGEYLDSKYNLYKQIGEYERT